MASPSSSRSHAHTLISETDESSSALDLLSRKRQIEESINWDPEDDWKKYMRIKHRKLNDQLHDLNAPKASSIFEGVSIYVNGWTQPNADELKEMIHSHGGHYEYNLYSDAVVTHTIASNLPNAKIKNLGKSIVCTPGWIVDSIAAGRQLPVDNYLLYGQEAGGQKRLSFTKKEGQHTGLTNNPQLGNEASAIADNGRPSTSVAKAYQPSQGAQFVNEFFTHSRLHYLSTWSTELKQFTVKMLEQVTPKYPKLSHRESLRSKNQRAVVHIDLDCFFVSVSIRDKPHLKGRALAVTHAKLPTNQEGTEMYSTSSTGTIPKHLLDSTSDIASCSYAARDAGVRNGMSVGKAMKLCPDLTLLPYDFEAYREVSQSFYEALLQCSSQVEAVSCDEAFIEFTDYVSDSEQVVKMVLELRNEIESKVGCTVSAGIAHNMLLARMCTRVAKPNGQFYLSQSETLGFLESQDVHSLPGVGHSTARKLKEISIETCSQLSNLSLGKLQETFGQKTGKVLYNFARGVDDRELKTSTERKSVSVDINYGIRFKAIAEAESLIGNLAKELEKRASEAGVLGGTVVLKMKIRQVSAPKETWKHLGHGACDNVTRSFTLLQPTRSSAEVTRLAVRLLKQVSPVPGDIRGMGLQLSKLVPAAPGESHGSSLGLDLRNFMKPDTHKSEPRPQQLSEPQLKQTNSVANFFGGAALAPPKEKSCDLDLPPLSQLDNSVLDALPDSIRDEILQGYVTKATKTAGPGKRTGDLKQTGGLKSVSGTLGGKAALNVKKPQLTTENTKDDSFAIIKNESEFLRDMRAYVKDWILHFIEGPPDGDIEIFFDYLLKLSICHLDIVTLILKATRRLVARLELGAWFSVFNSLLDRVQESVRTSFNGHLPIDHL